jgi:hypothetical protein
VAEALGDCLHVPGRRVGEARARVPKPLGTDALEAGRVAGPIPYRTKDMSADGTAALSVEDEPLRHGSFGSRSGGNRRR